MSSSLYWRPPLPNGEPLSYEIKRALQDHLGGTISGWQPLNRHDVGFLHGVIAGAGAKTPAGKDAQLLIEMIEKYDSIEIREVH